MNKKILYITLGIFALLIFVLIFNSKKIKYITKPIVKDTIIQSVEASGTIKPINTIAVGTQVSGTVARIYVDYNSVVKKGDMLAELDPSLFQSNVDQSTAKLNNAQATLAKATSTLNYKKNNYQRYNNLYKKNYVSKDEVEPSVGTDVQFEKSASMRLWHRRNAPAPILVTPAGIEMVLIE